jgi:pimeloyl-ACP methyl ester carboxylesterase
VDEVALAAATSRDIQAVHLNGEGRGELLGRLQELEQAPWFADSGLRLMPQGSNELRRWLALPMNFDPAPLLARLDCPVFAAQGEQDLELPGVDVARELQALASSHPGVWVVLIPGAGHTLREPRSVVVGGWSWPTAYWEALEAWLDEHVLAREVSAS